MPCKACEEFKKKHVRYKNTVRSGSGNPSDYTQACVDFDVPCPDATKRCTLNSQCRVEVCITGGCPPPLANSHLTLDGCYYESYNLCDSCVGGYCQEWGGSCFASGLCSYDCDLGFVWNGSACVVAPSVKPGPGSSNIMLFSILLMVLHQKKRKKRRVIASILT